MDISKWHTAENPHFNRMIFGRVFFFFSIFYFLFKEFFKCTIAQKASKLTTDLMPFQPKMVPFFAVKLLWEIKAKVCSRTPLIFNLCKLHLNIPKFLQTSTLCRWSANLSVFSHCRIPNRNVLTAIRHRLARRLVPR